MDDKPFQIRDRRGGNRYFIDNAFLRGGWGAKIGPYGIAIYNALAMFADADAQSAWPSYQTIADLTGMSRRQAIRKVDKLAGYHIINKQERDDPKTESRNQTNLIILLHPNEWTSDSQSLVTHSHQGSDSQSPGVVTHSHPNKTQYHHAQKR